jgi:ribosomal protein S3
VELSISKGVSVEEQKPKTVTIGEKTYEIESLSNEVKELLSLHAQAQDMVVAARRQAIIHELSASNLAGIIRSKVETDESKSDLEGPLASHVVQ